MQIGDRDRFDRKLRANSEAYKNQGSYASHAQMPLVRIPGHQARLRRCSPIDSSPILLHPGPENANSVEPDQRTQVYDCHSSELAPPLYHRPEQFVPLDRTFIITFQNVFVFQDIFGLPKIAVVRAANMVER